MLRSPRLRNRRKPIELPAALRHKVCIRIFEHVVDAVGAATSVVASEARSTTPCIKYDVKLVFGKMPIKLRNIDPSLSTSWSRRLFPIGCFEALFLAHPVTDTADGAESESR